MYPAITKSTRREAIFSVTASANARPQCSRRCDDPKKLEMKQGGEFGIMRSLILLSITAFVLQGSPLAAFAGTDELRAKPVVVIDAGHTNKMPGALSITGRHEVEYNDSLVLRLSEAIAEAGFAPVLTRRPAQEIRLQDRANLANTQKNAILMLSIHHDSAQLVHLEPVIRNGIKTYRTRKPISGYSIFVSKKNPQFNRSLSFAKMLGRELLKLGRKPSLHHAEPIPGEGRPLLDANLGIYQYDDLVVLKKTKIPAVLLEVGVIVDPADEGYVSDAEKQGSIISATIAAIKEFVHTQQE
jgi:N-acetylmuramoyl-L-alanine amidase